MSELIMTNNDKTDNDNVGLHPGAAVSQRNINTRTKFDVEGSDAPGCIPTFVDCVNDADCQSDVSDARADSPMVQHLNNGIDAFAYPQRKNIRAEFHDYSGGLYFVTICTRDKEQFFGKIFEGEMKYSPIGDEAVRCLETLSSHYRYVEVPLFVVMPNHVHAIIFIREKADAPGCIPTIRTALGVVVGGYKQSVTRFARRNNIEFGWQSRYHDHIIRGTHDGNRISEYIENNVAKWTNDCFYAE